MSANSTVYDVSIRYDMDDRASKGLEALGRSAEHADQSAHELTDTLKGLAGIFMVGEAFHKGKELFVDFNREMQNIRIQGAAMLQSNDIAQSFEDGTRMAGKMVDEFQRFAVTSPVTTKELAHFANGISVAVAQAGGGVAMIEKFTEQGVIAAKAFGANADYAALEITEGIQRGMTVRQRFLKQLVATQHVDQAQFNAMDATQRAALLMKALDSPAMKAAAIAFGHSFDGVTSTLKDNIEILGGKIGAPLFSAITVEIQSWNTWLKDNEVRVHDWGVQFSRYLMDGFGAVKSAVTFLMDHKDTLIKIGEVWAASKMLGAFSGGSLGGKDGFGANQMAAMRKGGPGFGQVAGGAMMGVALGGLTGADSMVTTIMGVTGALGTLPGPLGLLGTAATAAIAGLQTLANWVTEKMLDEDKKTADAIQVMDLSKRVAEQGMFTTGAANSSDATTRRLGRQEQDALYGPLVAKVRDLGAFNQDATVDDDKLRRRLSEMDIGTVAAEAIVKDVHVAFDHFQQNGGLLQGRIQRLLGLNTVSRFDPDVDKRRKAEKTHVNVTIQKIEVASQDPDRFAFGLDKAFKKLVQNPTAARDALRGGF